MSVETKAVAPRPRGAFKLISRAITVGSWLSLVVALVVWGILRLGDSWWLGTFVMFFPRWVWVIPSALLTLACAVGHRRSLVPALLALGLAVGPVMGLSIPWQPLLHHPSPGLEMRVLTCNIHYGKTDPALLDALLDKTQPDVVALQEWRDSAHSEFLTRGGWHVKRLPGLCLASRYPIRRMERLGTNSTGERGSAMLYELDTPVGVITVLSLHLDSPRDGLGRVAGEGWAGRSHLQANSERRKLQSEFLAGACHAANGHVLVMGDFNTPPESTIFRRIWADYKNAFDEGGLGWGYTFVSRRTSARIDHILVGKPGRTTRCWVGSDIGSPHLPVIADIVWPAEEL